MYSGYVEGISLHNFDQGSLDDAQIIDTTLLPPEYMPLYYSPNPWNKFAAIEKDFVVIAEFSELEGPKPLICIPKDATKYDEFDLNAFVLKIMSVDHQSMNSKFCMPQDTQVVLDESKDGVYAYVHHFTLHDSQARGFVRPFCMAYVTPDSRKIMTFYQDIQRLFKQVSKNFKYGNLKLFFKDMKHYLADLQYTQEMLKEFHLQPEKPKDEMTEDEMVLSECCDRSLENIAHEIRDIIEVIQPLLDEDERLSKKFKVIEERAFQKETKCSKGGLIESSSFEGDPATHLRAHGKGKIRRSLSFSTDNVNVSMEEYSLYKPSLVKLHKRRFDKALRSLHELSLWGAKEGLNGIRNIHRYFCRDTATLLIEKKDSDLTEPPSCLLTIGKCVTVNFLNSPDNYEIANNNSWGLHDGSPVHLPSSPEKLTRWLSTDTLESFKSAESFFSVKEDFVKSDHSAYEPKFVAAGKSPGDYGGDGDSSTYDIISTPSDDGEIFMDASSCFTSQQDLNEALKATVSIERRPVDCPCEDNSLGLSSSESSDNFHHVGKKIQIPVISSAEHINNLDTSSPGYGILKFVNTHGYSCHLFASILMGRPVVVMGRLEKDVKDVLTTLSLFVPGYSSSHKTVVLSQNQPLKITDLSKLTLIGLVKPEKKSAEYLVPESIKGYVTLLDLEKKTLLSPEYESGVLKKVLKQKKVFTADEAYLAFIHCVLLDLASKAFVLYHWLVRDTLEGSESVPFLPDLHGAARDNEELKSYQQNRDNDKQLVEFMADLEVENGDIPIVKYFAEIIQIQQADDYYNDKMTGLPDKPSPPVRLDYRQAVLFKA